MGCETATRLDGGAIQASAAAVAPVLGFGRICKKFGWLDQDAKSANF
jgi:hypothetical protein